MTSVELLLLGFIFAGFTVQGATGFGAGVVSLSLGALFIPLDQLIPAFIPLALGIATTLSIKERKFIQGRVLFLQVLPAVLPMVGVGVVIFSLVDVSVLLPGFGVLAFALSIFELVRSFSKTKQQLLPRWLSISLLGAGGLAHGMFASGGPLIVLSLSRILDDKHSFRATVSAMWALLNVVMLGAFIYGGNIDDASLRLSAIFLPGVIAGLFAGEVIIRFLPELWFRRSVLVIVAGAGVTLVVKGVVGA